MEIDELLDLDQVRADPLLTVSAEESDMQLSREKSFHLDHYCFDSEIIVEA